MFKMYLDNNILFYFVCCDTEFEKEKHTYTSTYALNFLSIRFSITHVCCYLSQM